MKHPSSLFFTFLFIALLTIMAGLMWLAFYFFGNGAGVTELLNESSPDQISSTADFMSAVLGVPVALAGSVVAIYIAHRAYAVSQLQSEFEGVVYIEQLMERTADTFWSLAGALQSVDSSLNALVDGALRVPAVQELWVYGNDGGRDGESVDVLADLQNLDLAHRQRLEALATTVLLVLRDPLSAKCWTTMDNKSKPLFDAQMHPRSLAPGVSHGVWMTQTDPGSLSQSIRQSLSRTEISESGHPSLAVRLVAANSDVRNWKRNPETGRFEKSVSQPLHQIRSRPALSDQPRRRTVSKSIEEMISGVPQNMHRRLDDPTFRVLCAGAFLQLNFYVDRKTGIRMAYNAGAEMLVSIISRIPDEPAQAEALEAYLNESFEISPASRKKTVRSFTDKNIAGYTLPALREAAQKISADPSLLVMWAPRD